VSRIASRCRPGSPWKSVEVGPADPPGALRIGSRGRGRTCPSGPCRRRSFQIRRGNLRIARLLLKHRRFFTRPGALRRRCEIATHSMPSILGGEVCSLHPVFAGQGLQLSVCSWIGKARCREVGSLQLDRKRWVSVGLGVVLQGFCRRQECRRSLGTYSRSCSSSSSPAGVDAPS